MELVQTKQKATFTFKGLQSIRPCLGIAKIAQSFLYMTQNYKLSKCSREN